MINVITEFKVKSTVRVIAYVYDDAGELTEPSASIEISLWNPDGDKQLLDDPDYEADMVKNTDEDSPAYGAYEYFYETDDETEKGDWRGEVEVIDGTPTEHTSIGNFSFRVK